MLTHMPKTKRRVKLRQIKENTNLSLVKRLSNQMNEETGGAFTPKLIASRLSLKVSSVYKFR